MRACWFLAVALTPAIVEARSADEVDRPATIVVDLVAAPATRPWLAEAYQHSVMRELSGFERLSVAEPIAKADFATHGCDADTSCRLRVYKEAQIDIVLFGDVTDSLLSYELYQTWTPARLATGTIVIGRAQSLLGFKHETRDALHPVLKHGGLLDQRSYLHVRSEPSPVWTAFEPAAVGVAIVALMLPFGLLAARTRSLRRIATLRSARWTALVVAALAIAGLAGAVFDLAPAAELVAARPWAFAGLGGLAWGLVVISLARSSLPPLDGLTRVAPHDVWRIVRSWCAVVVLRLARLAALYAPLAVLAIWLGDRIAIPEPWRVILLVPAIWLCARLWVVSWIECLAAVLDDRLVDGVASQANPWSREIADYLMGYVRRTGWDADRELIARIVFVPGKCVDGVVSYGGGATHARVVIDKSLLELAMGELVEVKPEDKPALWPDWTVATVVPGAPETPRRAAVPAGYRGRKPRAASHVVVRKPLGQAATLLGYVFAAPGELVPLISDNPQDLSVVRALLSEHYPWNAPDPDDEFDATDPTDKDMLFGALVREIGVIRRQDCQLETFKLALGRRVARVLSAYPGRITDAYPALNFARDHFLQYLYHRWTGATDRLTARARGHQLHDTSSKILDAVRQPPARGRARSLRRRMIWVSWFFAEPIVDPRAARVRRLIVAGALAAVLGAAGVLVKRSIDYHAIYEDRIGAQQRAATAAHNAQPRQPEVTHDGEAKAQ